MHHNLSKILYITKYDDSIQLLQVEKSIKKKDFDDELVIIDNDLIKSHFKFRLFLSGSIRMKKKIRLVH